MMRSSALISVHDLHALLGDPRLRLVDASYPAVPDFHARARIGNAVLFDIDAVADQTAPLPHTLPDAAFFASCVGGMGIGNDDIVVVYDRSGIVSAAARVWWMFRCFGHRDVYVLDGGLPLWHAMGLPLESGGAAAPVEAAYTARFNPVLFAGYADVRDAMAEDDVLILDVRAAERFTGQVAEARGHLSAGHIPSSANLPFSALVDPGTGRLVRHDARIAAIAARMPRRIMTSCGSGVTACVVALALYEAGYENAAVYDGSWSEWGDPATGLPVETGMGRALPGFVE